MSIPVVRAAIDYLLEHSGEQKVLTINFFGGDRKREKVYSKRILFGITTNAILVNRQVIEFIKENEIQFLVSLDGDKKAHDAMRKNLFGKGTYEQTLRGAKLLLLNNPSITRVRATLSSANANIYAQDIQEGYKKIMKMVIDELRINNRFINFLEFTEDVCRIYAGRKLYYCGTGKWMRAVDPKGNLYPCQRFVGLEEYRLGNVWEGDTNRELLNEFHNLHIYSIPVCSSCWIRHLCGGGCPHVNLMVNGSLRSPDQQICRWFQYALSETMKLLAELGDAGEDHIIQRIYREGTAGQFDRSDTYA
ncbi:MAG: radical SAM protein [Thermoplasmatales archaeon]